MVPQGHGGAHADLEDCLVAFPVVAVGRLFGLRVSVLFRSVEFCLGRVWLVVDACSAVVVSPLSSRSSCLRLP